MKKMIAEIRVEALDEALRRWSNEADTRVKVARERIRKYTDRKLVYGVDWEADCGCSPEKVLEFAGNLELAGHLAAQINKMELEICEDMEVPIGYESMQEYDADVETMVKGLKEENLYHVLHYIGRSVWNDVEEV